MYNLYVQTVFKDISEELSEYVRMKGMVSTIYMYCVRGYNWRTI